MEHCCFGSAAAVHIRYSPRFISSESSAFTCPYLASAQTSRRSSRPSFAMSSSTSKPSPPKSKPAPDMSYHSTCRSSGKGQSMDEFEADTRLVHGGSHPDEWTTDPLGRTVVNPPVFRASTIMFPSMESIRHAQKDWPLTGLSYGRHGNPTTLALEELFSVIEGADNASLTSSGVAAVNASILAFVKAGDHILITDGAYEPTRTFADRFLKRFGVETTYFDPLSTPEQFDSLFQPRTKVVLLEAPSSLSFEITDVPTFAKISHDHGAKVVIDNTYGPTLFRPLELGCDVSVNAATKYLGGHSDLMMGITASRDNATFRKVKRSVADLGCPPGTDDAYLVIRGIRTLGVRLKQHGETGIALAQWLEGRPEVKRLLHPALESHPQHELFKSMFSAPCGLFGLQLVEGYSQEALEAMMDGFTLFKMGYSWGGYESLIMVTKINQVRSATKFKYGDGYGFTLRIHAGLEDVRDLVKDLEAGFARLNSFPRV